MMTSEMRFLTLIAVLLMFWVVSSDLRESTVDAESGHEPVVLGSTQPSDVRLKEQIRDLPYGLPELLKLHPVSYRLKDFPSRPKIGLIAQEVEPLVPEVVYLAPENPEAVEPRYYSINYAELVPLLIGAIQEQEKNIEQLESRLAMLESPVAQ